MIVDRREDLIDNLWITEQQQESTNDHDSRRIDLLRLSRRAAAALRSHGIDDIDRLRLEAQVLPLLPGVDAEIVAEVLAALAKFDTSGPEMDYV